MNKYYFIYYSCFSRIWVSNGILKDSYTLMCQNVIEGHPLEWQLETNKKYEPSYSITNGCTKSELYRIITWHELTYEEFIQFKDKIG